MDLSAMVAFKWVSDGLLCCFRKESNFSLLWSQQRDSTWVLGRLVWSRTVCCPEIKRFGSVPKSFFKWLQKLQIITWMWLAKFERMWYWAKELMVDFSRTRHTSPSPRNIQGRTLRWWTLISTWVFTWPINWTVNTSTLYQKGQGRFICSETWGPLGGRAPSQDLIWLHGGISWSSSSTTAADRKRWNKVVKKASSVLGCPLDHVEVLGDRRMRTKLLSIMADTSHPLQETVASLGSSFSDRLLHPRCLKERYCRSFLPAAGRLFNQACFRPTKNQLCNNNKCK